MLYGRNTEEIMKQDLKITCPKCTSEFVLESAHVSAQFEASIRKDLSAEIQRREEELSNQRAEFSTLSQEFQKEKDDFTSLIDQKVREQMQSREKLLKDSIHKQVQEEKEAQLAELENELKRKSTQLIELNQTKAKLQRLSLEMEEKEALIHLKMEEELAKRLSELKTSVKEQIQMESFLKLKEKQNIIDSLKQKLADATQRIEQGSMQMQGEMMELTVEEIVRSTFPTDEILEIKKGQRGGDAIQQVRTNLGIEAGRILFEVKNTKTWSDSFVDKVKSDNLDSRCDLMVIVTKTPPKEMEGKHFMLLNGVWVTSLNHLSDMITLLRFGLLKVQEQRQLHQNGDSKAHMLYAFLTSQECQSIFNSMMDGLKTIHDMNQEEERKLQTLFRKREKQLQMILGNFISYYGTVKGISDESIQDLEFLEFKKAS
jgi:hypothetical protein